MKIWKAAVVIVCLVLAVFILLQANSFPLALHFAGLEENSILYAEELDTDMTEFKVFQTATKDGKLALVRAEKNGLGFWYIADTVVQTEEKSFINMSWIKRAGMRRYSHKDMGIDEKEYHFVYGGSDAIKMIELYPEQLPKNAAVNIQQAGEIYMIHIVVYSAEGFLVEVRAALEKNGCVAPLKKD